MGATGHGYRELEEGASVKQLEFNAEKPKRYQKTIHLLKWIIYIVLGVTLGFLIHENVDYFVHRPESTENIHLYVKNIPKIVEKITTRPEVEVITPVSDIKIAESSQEMVTVEKSQLIAELPKIIEFQEEKADKTEEPPFVSFNDFLEKRKLDEKSESSESESEIPLVFPTDVEDPLDDFAEQLRQIARDIELHNDFIAKSFIEVTSGNEEDKRFNNHESPNNESDEKLIVDSKTEDKAEVEQEEDTSNPCRNLYDCFGISLSINGRQVIPPLHDLADYDPFMSPGIFQSSEDFDSSYSKLSTESSKSAERLEEIPATTISTHHEESSSADEEHSSSIENKKSIETDHYQDYYDLDYRDFLYPEEKSEEIQAATTTTTTTTTEKPFRIISLKDYLDSAVIVTPPPLPEAVETTQYPEENIANIYSDNVPGWRLAFLNFANMFENKGNESEATTEAATEVPQDYDAASELLEIKPSYVRPPPPCFPLDPRRRMTHSSLLQHRRALSPFSRLPPMTPCYTPFF